MLKDCKLATGSCKAPITDVKGVCIYMSGYVCIPKMQLAKFIRLESLKINEKNFGFKREIKNITYLKTKDSNQACLQYD